VVQIGAKECGEQGFRVVVNDGTDGAQVRWTTTNGMSSVHGRRAG
jgi:hypothetical protein